MHGKRNDVQTAIARLAHFGVRLKVLSRGEQKVVASTGTRTLEAFAMRRRQTQSKF